MRSPPGLDPIVYWENDPQDLQNHRLKFNPAKKNTPFVILTLTLLQYVENAELEVVLSKLSKTNYSWEELQQRPLPDGVDPSRLEQYLNNEDFQVKTPAKLVGKDDDLLDIFGIFGYFFYFSWIQLKLTVNLWVRWSTDLVEKSVTAKCHTTSKLSTNKISHDLMLVFEPQQATYVFLSMWIKVQTKTI